MKKFYHYSPLVLQTLIWPGTRFILWFFAHLEVRGLENLQALEALNSVGKTGENRKSGVIFASNHSSELDAVILPAGLPFLSNFMPIFYTSREKTFYKRSGFRQLFYGGWLFRLWGAQPIYTGLKDYEKSLINHIDLIHAGKSVMVFPEGGINKNGIVGQAHGGVAFLAARTDCPIVPINISGAYNLSLADFLLRRRKFILTIGQPIFFDEMMKVEFTPESEVEKAVPSIETYKQAANLVMEKVRVIGR